MFQFKQFSVNDDRSTMKVGTDAVVLGAWVNIGDAKTILDIGTGCGVIALMLAQRSIAVVDAVEADHESVIQASENFIGSPWAERLSVHATRIQDYEHTPYDLIVSNPPFFSNSLLPPTPGRQMARHTTTLSHNDLFSAVVRLLAAHGRFAAIVPEKSEDFSNAAKQRGLEVCRVSAVWSRPRVPIERRLLEFCFKGRHPVAQGGESLTLTDDGSRRTLQYSALTRDFYL